jgi:hypothetical protein
MTNIQCPTASCNLFLVLPCPSSPLASEVPVEVFPHHIRRITAVFTVNVPNYVHFPRSRGGRRTGRTRRVTHRFDLFPLTSQLCVVDDHPDHPTTTSNQPLEGESNFWDSSGPLFSIYSKAAEDEDNKMVERWQKDADGILIFVSLYVCICLSLQINWNTIDWSILCRSRCTPCRDSPGPEAKQSGYLRILPWEHLSVSRRPKRNPFIHSFPCPQTTRILSFEICRLGEFPLVLELGHER